MHLTVRSAARGPAALAMATMLAIMSIGCGFSQDDPSELDLAGGVQPEWVINHSQLIETEAGVRRWVLDYDKMVKFADRHDMDMVRVKMDFFEDGEYYSTLVSDSGIVDPKTHNVFVWGNVAITTDDGRRLRTSELHYNNHDGLIRNDVYNIFDRGLDTMTGIGLEATPDLDYVVIYMPDVVFGDDAVTAQPNATESR